MSHNYGGLGRSNQVIPRKQFLTFSQHADVYDKCMVIRILTTMVKTLLSETAKGTSLS